MSNSVSCLASLSLKRYPPQPATSPLKAQDSADEYLLNIITEQSINSQPVLIFNDSFGALTCALHQRHPYTITDSLISQLACRQNLKQNGLDEKTVNFLGSLQSLPSSPGLVIIKIPKQLSLLEYQLRQLRQVITQNCYIIAAGKVQDIHTSTLTLFEKIIGPTHTSLAKKKSRLIFSQYNPELSITTTMKQASWLLSNTSYQINNDANVFSRSCLDIGTRFFMEHLPHNLSGRIVDLGCGNGVIGLMALQFNPLAQVIFIDESYMAVASSQQNVQLNRSADLSRSSFMVNDCLHGVENASLQAVLCNPPFHQNNVITDHIARQMFRDSHRCLKIGGELRIIGNRHLGYHLLLKRLFGNCQTIASNKKFVVLKSVKQ